MEDLSGLHKKNVQNDNVQCNIYTSVEIKEVSLESTVSANCKVKNIKKYTEAIPTPDWYEDKWILEL